MKQIEIIPFQEAHVKAAALLAQASYEAERKWIDALYNRDYKRDLAQRIQAIQQAGYGAAALQDGKLVGYLLFLPAFENHFGRVRGTFSPLFANAVTGADRNQVFSLLFEHLAGRMVKEQIYSYAVCVYAHDTSLLWAMSLAGFGVRCSDAVLDITRPLNLVPKRDYRYAELPRQRAECLLPLKNALAGHLSSSPTFLPKQSQTLAEFNAANERAQARFFVVLHSQEPVGYLEIDDDGETFLSEDAATRHVCGAYLLPEHRGKELYSNLVTYAAGILSNEGIQRLEVDCETLNPTALHFWNKQFSSYTYSLVRRLDERIDTHHTPSDG